jgi:hypothetical protein
VSDILSGEWWDAACVGLAVSHPQTVRLLRAHNAALLALLERWLDVTMDADQVYALTQETRAALGGNGEA